MHELYIGIALGAALAAAVIIPVGLFLHGRSLSEALRKEALKRNELGEVIVRMIILLENSSVATYIFRGTRFLAMNGALARLTGYSRQELMAMEGLEHIHPDHRGQAMARVFGRERGEKVEDHLELKLLTKDGEVKWVDFTVNEVIFDGEMALVGSCFDITERNQTKSALHESEARYRFLTENIKDVVWAMDVETARFVYVSPSVERLRGYTPEEIIAAPVDEALTPGDIEMIMTKIRNGGSRFITDDPTPRSSFHTIELPQPHKDGSLVWTEVIVSFRKNPLNGRVELHGVTRDITGRKEAEARIAEMAMRDSLTGLPNRNLFSERLSTALDRVKDKGAHLGILFMDLDKFKPVNDSYGHAFGDVLLKQVAERSVACLNEEETIARIGGDEFVVLLPDASRVAGVADRLIRSVSDPFTIEGITVFISCSIGVSFCPEDGSSEIELVKNADEAMYRAKQAGGSCWHLFDKMSEPSLLKQKA